MKDNVPNKLQDSIYKKAFTDQKKFCEFLKEFTHLDVFDDVKPEEVTDETERFISLIDNEKECDVLKMAKVKDTYTLVLLEHQSKVNHLMPYRMFDYMNNIWKNFIESEEHKKEGISKTKGFKLPPIIPIIYYTGENRWTAEINFKDKVLGGEMFEKYIPNFKYDLVNLNNLTFNELKEKESALTLVMILSKVNKIETIEHYNEIFKDKEYVDAINAKLTAQDKQFLLEAITQCLRKLEASEEFIEEIVNEFIEGGVGSMTKVFSFKEIQKEAREKGMQEGKLEGKLEVVMNLLTEGFDEDMILKLAGVDREFLEQVYKEMEDVEYIEEQDNGMEMNF